MDILIVTQYFWPEFFIINDLVKSLHAEGHRVKILTGKPNYPDGEVFVGYKAQACQKDTFIVADDMFRVPLRPRGKNVLGLLLNYVSFLVNGWRYFPKALQDESFDIILAMGFSPITSVIPAIRLKRKKKWHLVLWVQDLWPESLSATGYVKNHFLLNLVGRMVKKIYRQSDTILMQSPAFAASIGRYVAPEKLIYYPNSYPDPLNNAQEPLQLAPDIVNMLANHFCIVFAGNIGFAQSIETWLTAARHLQDIPHLRIIIVGKGSCLNELDDKILAEKLPNIVTIGWLPASQMPHVYALSEALLVTLKKNDALAATIPSKIQAYMAVGKPIIGALDGAGAQLIKDAGAGLTCDAEDGLTLATCIRELYGMCKEERMQLGHAARHYFLTHFEMNKQARRLIDIFNERLRETT